MNIRHNKNIMNALIVEIENNPQLAKYFNQYFFISSFYIIILKNIFYFILLTFIYFYMITKAEQNGLYTYSFFFMISIFPFIIAGCEYLYNNQIFDYRVKIEKRLCCEFEAVLSQNKFDFYRMQSGMEYYEFLTISNTLLNKNIDTLDIIESIRKFKDINNFKTRKKRESLNNDSKLVYQQNTVGSVQPNIPASQNLYHKKSTLYKPFFSNEAVSGFNGDFYKKWQQLWAPLLFITAFSFCLNTQQTIERKAQEYFGTVFSLSSDKHSVDIALNKYNTIYNKRIHVVHKPNTVQINALKNFLWIPVIPVFVDNKVSIDRILLNNKIIDTAKNSEFNKILSSNEDISDKSRKITDYLKSLNMQDDNVLLINYHSNI